jgi:hypothetical protein
MGVMPDHNACAFGAAARAFRKSGGTLGSGSSPAGMISSDDVAYVCAAASATSVHLEPMLVGLETVARKDSIDDAVGCHHARSELRTASFGG